MIEINRKEDCCGCAACVQACPKSCITMSSDNEGFWYPNVDLSACVDCGLCERVCPIRHPKEAREPLRVLAAINKDEKIRMKSSSGGIFYLLAEKVISEGGVVFGARFDENWQVVLDYSETLDGVKPFMGSKYVQARVENAYRDARHFLDKGRKVLFSGTPCQISGLYGYLRKDYENLLTVDLVCHGVPSHKVWKMYLDGIKQHLRSNGGVEFRNKDLGWKNFSFKVIDETGTCSLFIPFNKSHYMKAFLSNIILRPSCYECCSKSGRSYSDITLADFWGISSILPEMNDDKGTSMLFVNTAKGESFLDFNGFRYDETEYECIKSLNPACFRSPFKPRRRDYFFNKLDSTDGLKELNILIDQCTRPSVKKKLLNVFRLPLRVAKKLVIFIIGGGKKETIDKLHNAICSKAHVIIPTDSKIVSVNFRDKSEGWSTYGLSLKIKE